MPLICHRLKDHTWTTGWGHCLMQSNLTRDEKLIVNPRSNFKCWASKTLAFLPNQTKSQHWDSLYQCRLLTVFKGAQELGCASWSIAGRGETQNRRVVRGVFLQVGDAAAMNTVKIWSNGDHGHGLRSIHWPCQKLENLNVDELSLEVVSIWNQSMPGCQIHLNLIVKKQATLLNHCQLWRWADGYNAVTMITGGTCRTLTSGGGHTDAVEVLQFPTSATEQRQNYCEWLFVRHESLVSLSGLLGPAWTASAAERKLSVLLWEKSFILFWGSFTDSTGWGG